MTDQQKGRKLATPIASQLSGSGLSSTCQTSAARCRKATQGRRRNSRVAAAEVVVGLVEDVHRVDDALGRAEAAVDGRRRRHVVAVGKGLVEEHGRAGRRRTPLEVSGSARGGGRQWGATYT